MVPTNLGFSIILLKCYLMKSREADISQRMAGRIEIAIGAMAI